MIIFQVALIIVVVISSLIFLVQVIRNAPPEISSPWDWEGYQRREDFNKKKRKKDKG